MDEYKFPRDRMLKLLREQYKIRAETVLRAMDETPRHLFVPDALKSQAYKDNALPIASKQTISQPFIVARMTRTFRIESAVESFGNRRGFRLSNGDFVEIGGQNLRD